MADLSESLQDRFWSKVDRSGDCWLWTGAKDLRYQPVGRFAIMVSGKRHQVTVHRLAYELTYGPVPTGQCVLQSCGNSLCINPEHLLLGQRSGGQRPRAGLTPQDILDIRARFAAGASQASIARRYNVSHATVGKIVRRLSWSHIN